MTATEELRALLDERGVEWRERKWGAKHSVTIFWRARGVRWHYRENQYGEVRLHADGLSPAQAVEATLGRGECWDSAGSQMAFFSCSACGATIEHKHPRFCFACGRKVVDE